MAYPKTVLSSLQHKPLASKANIANINPNIVSFLCLLYYPYGLRNYILLGL